VKRRRAAPPRVRLAISMGDPAGIGPEVVLKAITTRAVAARSLVGGPAPAAVEQELARLEADLHEHIHKENYVLFPRALAREAELRESAAAAAG